ncbi:Ribosome biogenesis protein BRX1 homolog [Strongyloides ratti]|uniref:Ribosome biogenesis protein BRX1 homolog n=1 Tax=Strongyloides ratti TaxID=34506 RepID=A0A090LLF7_STRRB|nr:Ribosome biogenesis protein BRX1 homolog [Strongyloides ratti]CEF68375.1 Ribosome biogenesis protein BRX1 homolog [Strongyloides ratti]
MGKKSGARRHRHAKELEDKVAEEMGTKKVQIDTVMESESDTDSDDGEQTKLTPDSKWQNRTRVLMMCSRGTIFRTRYLMKNLKNIMPHGKSESKFSKNEKFSVINEIAELQNCSKVMFFENRKHKDTYLWLADASNGPSVKFLVHNIHTMEELKMVGNCLKGSRPILSFDDTFDTQPHFQLIKELLKSIFSTPNHHPRSQPFIDHVFTFTITPDEKIWFRNFQIPDPKLELLEVGPRFVLELIRIFDGSFEGAVLYSNPTYISPNTIRREIRMKSRKRKHQ